MSDFGFKISTPRSIDLDSTDQNRYRKLLDTVPSYHYCIGCGGCSATCTAAQFTDFNIRKAHTMFSRGQYDQLAHNASSDTNLDKCMLCGKCTLICPRGVNTRGIILQMRQLLASAD